MAIWEGWGNDQATWQVPDWLGQYYDPGGQQIEVPMDYGGFGAGYGMPLSYTYTTPSTYLGMQLPSRYIAGYLQQLIMANMNKQLGQDTLQFNKDKWAQQFGLMQQQFGWNKDVWGKEFGQRKVESLRNFGSALMAPLLSWEMGRMSMPTAGQMLRAKGWLV